MRRYAETFFRYWLLILVPIIVFPLAGYMMVRHTPKTVVASTSIWVAASDAGAASDGSYNQWVSPAQNQAATLGELIQSSSFDMQVARNSPLYAHMLVKQPGSAQFAVADLTKNLAVAPRGTHLLVISYSSKDAAMAVQILESFLTTAYNTIQQLNQQQSAQNINVLNTQLRAAQQTLTTSSKKLHDYMRRQGITPDVLIQQQSVDPTLATVVAQVQSDQTNVTTIQQQISKLQSQGGVSGTGFRIQDPPAYAIASSKKTILLDVGIAAAIGLILGLGFLVARTLADSSLRYADEIPELLELPVLGVVPFSATLAAKDRGAARPKQRRLITGRQAADAS